MQMLFALALPLQFYVHMHGPWPSSPLPVWQGQKQEFAHGFEGRKSAISSLPPMREKMDVLAARDDLQLNMGSKPRWESATSESFTSSVIGEGIGRRVNNPHVMRPVSKPRPSSRKTEALLLHQQISQTASNTSSITHLIYLIKNRRFYTNQNIISKPTPNS